MGSRASQKDRSSYLLGVGKALDYLFDHPATHDVRVVGVNIRIKPDSALIILKGVSGEGPKVAFVGASNALQAVREAGARLRDGDVRWREDRPYTPVVDSDDDGW